MCVIFYKPSGTPLPPLLDLKKMYWDNDDGIGFMSIARGEVVGQKFQTLDQFLDSVHQVPKKGVVIGHFRTATHGGRGIEYAQPFPFPVKEKAELYATHWVAPLGVAHNGVLTGFGQSMYGSSSYTGGDGKTRVWVDGKWKEFKKGEKVPPEETKLSDTQDFIWFLSTIRSLNRAVQQQDPAVMALLRKLVTSKFAFLSRTGKVRLIGEWKQEKGIWFSNRYWEKATDPSLKHQPGHFNTTTPTPSKTGLGTVIVGKWKPSDATEEAYGNGLGAFPMHYPNRGGSVGRSYTMQTGKKEEKDKEKEGDSQTHDTAWKLRFAEVHCCNWEFCTQAGRRPMGCLSSNRDHCAYFEEAVLPCFK